MTFEEELKKSGRLVYTNKGVSMMPLLRQGRDLMVIEACRGEEVKRLDAVLFTRQRKEKKDYVLHRVLRLEADGSFWIIGDNCINGENVKKEQILGRLTAVVRDGKKIEVTDKRYLLYVYLWCSPYHLRILLQKIRMLAGKCIRYAKRRIRHEK